VFAVNDRLRPERAQLHAPSAAVAYAARCRGDRRCSQAAASSTPVWRVPSIGAATVAAASVFSDAGDSADCPIQGTSANPPPVSIRSRQQGRV